MFALLQEGEWEKMGEKNRALDKNLWKRVEYWKSVLSWPLSAMVGQEYMNNKSLVSQAKRIKSEKRTKCT